MLRRDTRVTWRCSTSDILQACPHGSLTDQSTIDLSRFTFNLNLIYPHWPRPNSTSFLARAIFIPLDLIIPVDFSLQRKISELWFTRAIFFLISLWKLRVGFYIVTFFFTRHVKQIGIQTNVMKELRPLRAIRNCPAQTEIFILFIYSWQDNYVFYTYGRIIMFDSVWQ